MFRRNGIGLGERLKKMESSHLAIPHKNRGFWKWIFQINLKSPAFELNAPLASKAELHGGRLPEWLREDKQSWRIPENPWYLKIYLLADYSLSWAFGLRFVGLNAQVARLKRSTEGRLKSFSPSWHLKTSKTIQEPDPASYLVSSRHEKGRHFVPDLSRAPLSSWGSKCCNFQCSTR